MIPATFKKLDRVVLPAVFWPAYGYEGKARYVAIYWTAAGDEASYDDGRTSLVGADWPCYQAVTDGLVSRGLLAWAEAGTLGSSDEDGTHKLVCDRETGEVYYAPSRDAYYFLNLQWTFQARLADFVAMPPDGPILSSRSYSGYAPDEPGDFVLDPTLADILEGAALEGPDEAAEDFSQIVAEVMAAWQPPSAEEMADRIMAHRERVAAFYAAWEEWLAQFPAIDVLAQMMGAARDSSFS